MGFLSKSSMFNLFGSPLIGGMTGGINMMNPDAMLTQGIQIERNKVTPQQATIEQATGLNNINPKNTSLFALWDRFKNGD